MAHPPKRRITPGDLGLAPLLNPATGERFERLPCEADPASWDEDAPIEVRRRAASVCRAICPAVKPCWERRQILAARASGVWAGRVLRDRGDARAASTATHDDPELASWAASAGVTIRPTPTRKGEQ